MREDACRISVVIPLFNEEKSLLELHRRLVDVLLPMEGGFEIIFVDDGSSDNSFQVLKRLHERDKKIKVIRFARNFGQHPALAAGLDCARGDIVITLDADLQNPPEEIPKLIDKLEYELKRLEDIGGWDAVVPSEGLTFLHKGQLLKLTGAFAPINQLIGLSFRLPQEK